MTVKPYFILFRVTWWLILIYFQILTVKAQSHHFINYTVKDGLSSNEVYAVLQDRDGSMLFATDRGLQRFDGNEFQSIPFEREDLTLSAVIFHIHMDSSSTIWINTFRNGVFYLDQDTLKEHPFNAQIKEDGKSELHRFLVFDKAGSLYFFYNKQRSSFVRKVQNDGSIIRISYSDPKSIFVKDSYDSLVSPKRNFSLFKVDGKPIFAKPHFAIFSDKVLYYEVLDTSIQNQPTVCDSLFSFFTVTDGLDENFRNGLNFTLNEHNGEIWTAYKRNLLHLDSNLTSARVSDFPGNIQDITSFRKDQIICTKEGAYLLRKKGDVWVRDTILKNIVTTNAHVDNNGGVWITTTTKGIFYSPNLSVKKLSLLPGKNDVSYVETNDSLLAFFLRPNHVEVQRLSTHTPLYISKMTIQTLFLEGSYMQTSKICLDFKNYPNLNPTYTHTPICLDITRIPGTDTIVICTQSLGIQFLSKGGNWEDERPAYLDTNTPKYTACFFNKELYVGDAKGIYKMNRNTGKKQRFLPKQISGLISDIDHINNHLLISTLNNGLFVCKDEELFYHSEVANTIIPRICGKLMVENDSTFWMASDKGLIKLVLLESGLTSTLFTTDDGLISNGINDLSISNGVIYMGTDQGVCFIKTCDLKTSFTSIPFQVHFPNLNLKYSNDDIVELKKGKRDIYLVVNEKSINHSVGLSYSYILNNDTSQVIFSPLNSISFGNLKPGLNQLSINVANVNGKWNGKPTLIKIWAPPHLYEKSSFKMLFVLSSLTLIILSTYLFYRQKDRNRKRQFDFALAQYNTLSLQLSPHFIFNSLNNIQYLSISKSHIAVNQFVANLAHLTRNILEHAKQQLIPLATEIENLKLYLEIEKNRFEHKPIKIDFKVDPKIDTTNSLIPPMIIQPSVENAIWHGLLNKKSNRNLSIQINALDKGFEVKIIDNGIGLNTSQDNDLKIKGQTSIGIKNTQQRINLYNQMNLGIASYSLIELTENNKPIGTKAHFTFKPSLKSNS